MTSYRLILSTALVLGIGTASTACVSEASIDNDRTASALKPDAGSESDESDDSDDSASSDDDDDEAPAAKDAGTSTAKDASKPAVKDTGTATSQSDAASESPPETGGEGVEPTEPTESGEPTEPAEPMMSVVEGSATKKMCSSYGPAKGGMCAGYFCGVTEEQIAAEVPADTLCGENAAAGACDNKLPTALATCARSVKSDLANVGQSDEQLRPKVKACVFKDAELKEKTPDACMDCFLDAAECAGALDHCLGDCLGGDSKGCDTCRAKYKCDVTAIKCAKIPNPF